MICMNAVNKLIRNTQAFIIPKVPQMIDMSLNSKLPILCIVAIKRIKASACTPECNICYGNHKIRADNPPSLVDSNLQTSGKPELFGNPK